MACEITVGGARARSTLQYTLTSLGARPSNGVGYTSVQLDTSRIQLEDSGKPLDLSGAVMNFIPAGMLLFQQAACPAPTLQPRPTLQYPSRMRSITWKMATGMEGDVEAAVGGMEAPARVPITLTHVQYTEGRS